MNNKNFEQPLYHFCSYDTFVKIIQTKKIYMSDITKSNDKFELQLCHAIANEISEEINIYIGKYGIERFKKDFSLLYLEQDIRNACTPNLAWTFCLSKDIKQLWQWREYANDLKGIAFETRLNTIKEYINFLNSTNETVSFRGINIKYISELPKAQINGFKNWLQLHYKNLSQQNILNSILRFALKFKLDVFNNESEYRIYGINKVKKKSKKLTNNNNPRAVGKHILYDKYGETYELKNVKYNIDFKCLPKNDDIVSHIECPIKDISRFINRVWYYDGFNDASEIKQLLNIYIPNNEINVEPFIATYVPR